MGIPASPASDWLLEVNNLSCGYGGESVVKDVSFALSQGDIGCLLGPSGCGKSTILRALAGFLPLDAGEIRLASRAISLPGRTLAPEKRRIGMVFQDYALFPHLNIADNVGFGLKDMSKVERRHKVLELLDLVHLKDLADSYPHELSGGQQQRVALARALAPEPTLILLDEPFSNLDADLRRRLSLDVRDILKTLGISALLVTHDQQEAFAMCDQVAVLRDGRLLQWDVPYNLYHEPANRFVASFVGQGGFIPGKALGPDTIESELGIIRGNRAYKWPPGTLVDVLIRPDDIVYAPDSELRPRVIEKTFAGTSTLYRFRCSEETEFEALFRSHLDFHLGEHVPVRVEADHLIAFERSA
ncbi:ABC transporter ATP-binding protein [Marinobacter lutaoensis]|jgi:iron(III) transport system ATP-binding protein|uniref:Iron ABC transporter ATP-binding protein n=1 Tax=Marinobacter lutaoensis TaxID=135739 RepID=A0A1V2DQ63_9GAMM|nr:ABC transporter ATP-binding protein [Marinobacter lutaoensis]MBI43036.1 ABC transporter ATP-binding protein [Oceanospirillales bacterium]ONF42813.1 iron ABC transporter ATP-binding protein [Marinobacter lutaoensis]|tara:strand:+ start:1881 stop:2954 length:1074 start_codon:yes stop_codon:yes gene_type:complete